MKKFTTLNWLFLKIHGLNSRESLSRIKEKECYGSCKIDKTMFDLWEFTPECSMATMDEPVIKSLI